MHRIEAIPLAIAEEIRTLREALETLNDRITEAYGLWQIRPEPGPFQRGEIVSSETDEGRKGCRR